MSNLSPVRDENFAEQVLQQDLPVLVDFTATWCGPCRALAPTLEKLAGEFQGRVKFFSLDVDEARQTAQRFGVMSVPTVMLFKQGQVVGQSVGNQPRDYFVEMLNRALGA